MKRLIYDAKNMKDTNSISACSALAYDVGKSGICSDIIGGAPKSGLHDTRF